MEKTELELYRMRAEIAQAMGHPIRMAVVDFLKDGEKCVCEISKWLGSQRSNVSRHLAVLQNAGLITGRKDGLWMRYSLNYLHAGDMISIIDKIVKEKLTQDTELLKRLG